MGALKNYHHNLYKDGLWECPKTGMLIPLGQSPYTDEEIAQMERQSIDAHLDDIDFE
ncbi:hypothetical protein SWPG_00192 [Synechococcus phage S-CBM2]|nr:hypothetical protein SWPG_00192 [Synechococcus phage S-CBM2]